MGEECCYRFLRIYKTKERRCRTYSPIGRGPTVRGHELGNGSQVSFLFLFIPLFTLRDLTSNDGGNGTADNEADEEAPDEAAFPLLASASEEHGKEYSTTIPI